MDAQNFSGFRLIISCARQHTLNHASLKDLDGLFEEELFGDQAIDERVKTFLHFVRDSFGRLSATRISS